MRRQSIGSRSGDEQCASSSSIGAYSYFNKQQELLKYINDARQLLQGIVSDHRDERFPLGYPRHSRTDASPTGEEKSWSRSPAKGHSRSISAGSYRSRFSLIGLASGNAASVLDLSVLDEGSLGKLLTTRLEECLEYLDRTTIRVKDRSSRVLIAGDLNGGKSTLVNAMIGEDLLPVDQQPCTQAFCEVVPCQASQDEGKSQVRVHAIPDYDRYSVDDPTTFDIMSLSRMQGSVQEEDSPYQWYRLFIPTTEGKISSSSLLSNDFVSVSLIDSPGLNSDLFKTMNLFTRQEEIDVVVFVVNAANHLTLSAREFLETAGRDKAFIFIVVNKFDDIRNRAKCQKIVLGQIAEVLPSTGSEANDLVHFISAQDRLEHARPLAGLACSPVSAQPREADEGSFEAANEEAFDRLQSCLAEFILSKRTKSKLLPAKTYLLNLLSDLSVLLEYNERGCQVEITKTRKEIELLAPCYEELVKREGPLKKDLLHGVTAASDDIYKRAISCLSPRSLNPLLRSAIDSVDWKGVHSVFSWRSRAIQEVNIAVEAAIGEAKRNAAEALTTALAYLGTAASSHASTVFGKLPASESGLDLTNAVDPVVDVEPKRERPFEVVEWIGYGMIRGGGAMSTIVRLASASMAAVLPLVGPSNIASYLIRLGPNAPFTVRPRLVAISGIAIGLASIYLCLGDVEHAARRLLYNRLSAYYTENPAWAHRHAHAIESSCHQRLLSLSSTLLGKYQEALSSQRRLRAEKDLVKAQLSERLERIVHRGRLVQALCERTKSLQL